MAEMWPLIAVVDDEPSILKAIARLLSAAKFDVVTFESGAAFLASLPTRRPACVVLDLHMPGMGGFEVQAHLADDPGAKVPVVMITAQDSASSQQRAMSAGGSAYLRKPMDSTDLLNAIHAATAKGSP